MALVLEQWTEVQARCDRCGDAGWLSRMKYRGLTRENAHRRFNRIVRKWAGDAAPGLVVTPAGKWTCPGCKVLASEKQASR
jgi:hypothetical protein